MRKERTKQIEKPQKKSIFYYLKVKKCIKFDKIVWYF